MKEVMAVFTVGHTLAHPSGMVSLSYTIHRADCTNMADVATYPGSEEGWSHMT